MRTTVPAGMAALPASKYGPPATDQKLLPALIVAVATAPRSYQISIFVRANSTALLFSACTRTLLTPGRRVTPLIVQVPCHGVQVAGAPFTRMLRVSMA